MLLSQPPQLVTIELPLQVGRKETSSYAGNVIYARG
jgi:hypothetical protein